MIKALKRKWRYNRQKDHIDVLLMYVISSGRIGVELPVEDNDGKVVNRPVVGYNKTKVFLDINHRLAWLSKDRIALSDKELYALIDIHETGVGLPMSIKAYNLLKKFAEHEKRPVRLRSTVTGQIYRAKSFSLDVGTMMDKEDPPYHAHILIEPDYHHKIHYLKNMEITPAEEPVR